MFFLRFVLVNFGSQSLCYALKIEKKKKGLSQVKKEIEVLLAE